MKYARIGASLAFAAALAACSGNIGGGQSSLPGGPAPLSQIAAPVPTSSPVSASNIASVGADSTAPQPLPTVAGYGGTIAFPKPVPETPNPKAKATATPSGGPLAVGVTSAIVEPTDAPKFNPVAESRRHKIIGNHKEDPTAPKALLYITLLATGDVTFDEYPRIAIDVPRDVVTKYRDGTFGLALFDPADKAKRYRLAVAERDTSVPVATTATAKSTPTPTPTPVRSPSPLPSGMTPGPITTPTPAPAATLPPERITFNGTAAPLFLKENRPVVFALYAIPQPATPKPAPSESGSPAAKSTASPVAKPSGSPVATPIPSPTGS